VVYCQPIDRVSDDCNIEYDEENVIDDEEEQNFFVYKNPTFRSKKSTTPKVDECVQTDKVKRKNLFQLYSRSQNRQGIC